MGGLPARTLIRSRLATRVCEIGLSLEPPLGNTLGYLPFCGSGRRNSYDVVFVRRSRLSGSARVVRGETSLFATVSRGTAMAASR